MCGLDLCILSKREEDYIKICESNLIKHILNLHYKNRHTALILALDIISFDEYIKIAKMQLFIQLTKLSITRKLINTSLKTINEIRFDRNDLVKEIYLLTKDNLPENFRIDDLILNSEKEISRIISNHNSIRNNDNLTDQLKEIFSIKSPAERVN